MMLPTEVVLLMGDLPTTVVDNSTEGRREPTMIGEALNDAARQAALI